MSVTGFLKQLFSGENDSVKVSTDSAVPAMAKHKSNKSGNQSAENNNQNNQAKSIGGAKNTANLITNEQLPRLTADDLPAFLLDENNGNELPSYLTSSSINGTGSINGMGYTGGTGIINTNQPFVIDGLDEFNELELINSQESFSAPPSNYTPISEGDALLANTFNVSDQLLNILGPTVSKDNRSLVIKLQNNVLDILCFDERSIILIPSQQPV